MEASAGDGPGARLPVAVKVVAYDARVRAELEAVLALCPVRAWELSLCVGAAQLQSRHGHTRGTLVPVLKPCVRSG